MLRVCFCFLCLHAAPNGIAQNHLTYGGNLGAEGYERFKLPIGEHHPVFSHAIVLDPKTECLVWKISFRNIHWARGVGGLLVVLVSRQINSATFALCDYCHKPKTNLTGSSCRAHVLEWDWILAQQASKASSSNLRARPDHFPIRRVSNFNREAIFPKILVDDRAQPRATTFLCGKPKGTDEWNMHTSKGRIRACDGAGPNPSDYW